MDPNHFRDIPLPSGNLIDLLLEDPARKAAVCQEVLQVTEGNFQPIHFGLDPVTGFSLVCVLNFALRHLRVPDSGQIIGRISGQLETQIRLQCPELGRLLGDLHRMEGGAA